MALVLKRFSQLLSWTIFSSQSSWNSTCSLSFCYHKPHTRGPNSFIFPLISYHPITSYNFLSSFQSHDFRRRNNTFYGSKFTSFLFRSSKSLEIYPKFIFLILIYLFLSVLGLRCRVRAFATLHCGKWGLLSVAVRGLLIVVASLAAEHRL